MRKKVLFLLSCLLLCSCNNESTSTSTSSIEEIVEYSIEGPTSVGVGEIVVYNINYEGEITWESSDSLILNINSKGEAVSYKEGMVIISALDENKSLLASIEVFVVAVVEYPENELELSNLFLNAFEFEKETSKSKLVSTSTSIEQTFIQEAEMYNDFYIKVVKDEYTNYSGYHNEESTEFVGIKEGYFYDISVSNISSYAIKREIVNSNPNDYEILENEAISRKESPKFVNSFYSKLSEMWGARTLELNIECSENEKGYNVHLSNTYLFVWANGIDNDSKYYEASLNFSNDGKFLDGNIKFDVYEDSQYDVTNNKWKENAKVKCSETYSYEAEFEEKKDSNDCEFIPEDYFVKSVTLAVYEPLNPLVVGDRIIRDYIVLKEYDGVKALDYKNIIIKGVKNEGDEAVIVEDQVNGGYVVMNEGKAYLICQMMYSKEVTFLVEVNVG